MEDNKTPNTPSGGESGGSGGEKKKNTGKQFSRIPRAAVVWLVVLLVIGVLALFRDNTGSRQTVFTQSEFENMLRAGRIVTAEITDESNRVFVVEGRYRLAEVSAGENGQKQTVDAKKMLETTGYYRARVLFSESMNDLLAAKTQVKIANNNSNLWNFLLFP